MQNDEQIRQLSERLDKIEHQNFRLKSGLLLMVLLMVSVGATKLNKDDDVVATRTLIIHDGERNRIAMGVNDDGKTFINAWDEKGKWVRALGEEQP